MGSVLIYRFNSFRRIPAWVECNPFIKCR
jgi:hypothetical protein